MFNPVFVRRDPFAAARSDLNHVLANFFTAGNRESPRRDFAGFPALNVSETEESYILEAELPGVSKDDLEISVVGNELSISGERKPITFENASAHRREINYGKFARRLQFRSELDANAVEAVFKDGVLTLKLPKAPHSRPKKINISTH